MASSSKANNCAVCSKQVFLFEDRVKTKDLKEQEQTSCSALISKNRPEFQKLLETNEAILCMSCYRKVKASKESEQLHDPNAERGHGINTNTSPRHRPKGDHRPSSQTKPSTPQKQETKNPRKAEQEEGTVLVSGTDPGKNTPDINKAERPPARLPAAIREIMAIVAAVLVPLTVTALWLEAPGIAAGSLAVGLIIIIVKASPERHEIRAWLHHNAEQWGVIAEQVSGVAHQEVTVDAVSAVLPGVSPGGMSMDTLVEDGYCVTSAKEVEDFTQSPHAEQEGKVSASGISEHEVAMAATSAVFPGVSLTGTTTHALLHDGYRVTCAIEVENWTRFRLTDPHVQLNGGVLTVAPSSIVPAAREVTVGRKTSGTATGSCGTVSWIIENNNRRFVIMWSAPFNFNHYSNWLGIGLSAAGVTEHAHGDAWFNLMYYEDSSDNLKFERHEYYTDVHPVFYRDADFEVEGTMASDHKALVKVILRPVNRDNLASRIKEEMGLR